MKAYVFLIGLMGAVLLGSICFASPPVITMEKIDDYHIKVIKTKNHTNSDGNFTTTKEKVYSLQELLDKKASHETAKQSWVDSQSSSEITVEENIAIQQEEIDAYDTIISECENLNITVETPAEE